MNNFDVGWAAGFFEGEGSITKPKHGGIQLQLASIDRDTLEHFQSIVGGKIYGPYGPYQPRRKPHWRWDAYGVEAVRVLDMLLPHLGLRRTQRAIEVLQKVETP